MTNKDFTAYLDVEQNQTDYEEPIIEKAPTIDNIKSNQLMFAKRKIIRRRLQCFELRESTHKCSFNIFYCTANNNLHCNANICKTARHTFKSE